MLEGEYVALRAIDRSDLPHLLAWRNRPAYRQFFREVRELGADHQERWFETVVLGDPRTHMFAITERRDGRLLGACGLCYINWVHRSADFSIYIGADDLYIDQKFAPDTGRVLLRYGFASLGLHRIWAEIYDHDEAKQALFADLNMSLDGRHRETSYINGVWRDSLFYSILGREFA